MTLWYEDLRNRYRPAEIRVVIVGESPPDPGDANRRFFYSPTLFSADNLFRGLMRALYGAGPEDLVDAKSGWLDRFQGDGFWLLDLTDVPVNLLSPSQRRGVRRSAASGTAARIRAIRPALGVLVCHGPTYAVLAEHMRIGPGGILHDAPIPFPLGNHRARFVYLVRGALLSVGIEAPLQN